MYSKRPGIRLICRATMVAFLSAISSCGQDPAFTESQATTDSADGTIIEPGNQNNPGGIDTTGSSPGVISCVDASATANPGQSIDLKLNGFDGSTSVSVQDSFGSAVINKNTLTYTAPAVVRGARDVELSISNGLNTRKCKVKVIGTGDILIPDDGTSRALLANVYQLVPKSRSMAANFDGQNIKPIAGLYMAPNVNVPSQPSNLGFPGMRTGVNTEDYVISFQGKLKIELEGMYEFQVAVDDGAVMWLNSSKVINADGWATEENRASRSESGAIRLTKGSHPFKLNYYQGPACCIAIVLKWKKPGDSNFSVVPASAFDRPDVI